MHSKIRIVIADSDPVAVKVILDYLKMAANVEVLGLVNDGREAIEIIACTKPDVLIISLQLDYYDGIEVVQRSAGRHNPLVVFTSALEIHGVKAFDLNALDYLLKPFDEERLDICFARIRAILVQR